jgi:phospholipid/cholesterol/gamma-HCH transport system substrate-binding protein
MSQSYRFRYAEEIAGGFVLLCLGLLIVGIYTAGHAQGWFNKKLVLKVKFEAEKGTYGIQEGAEVRILGTQAGWVGEIVPSEESGMETVLILQGKFRKFVRTDSIAKVKKKFEVAGDSYVDITLGNSAQPMLKNGDYIPCVQDVELIEAAKKMVDDFRAAAVPMLEEVRATLSHVSGITGQLEKREGVAGKIIGDPQWAADVQQVIKDVGQTSAQLPLMAAQVDGVLINVQILAAALRESSATFPKITEGAVGVVQDIRTASGGLTGQVANVQAVLMQAESMLRETQALIEGIQKHWLVRSYIQKPDATVMQTPWPEVREGRTP